MCLVKFNTVRFRCENCKFFDRVESCKELVRRIVSCLVKLSAARCLI